MRIVSTVEDKSFEKRVSITPEIVKKYISIGLDVSLPKNFGVHLGFSDQNYESQGAKIINDEKELLNSGDIIVQLNLPSEDKLSNLKENQILIGVLNPFKNKEKIDNLIIKDHMSKKPLKVEENMLAFEILHLMNKKKITNICVYNKENNHKTTGVLHIHNLLNNLK